MNGPFYILSIDGGGFRGLFAAHLLRRMEEKLQVDWRGQFRLLAGTSTGAILSAGLACEFRASELATFYDEHGDEIFTPRLRSRLDWFKLFASRYSNGSLRRRLHETFKQRTLGQVAVPLVLPAVDINNGRVHVFKSKYNDGFHRDPDVLVADAVLASCAAPTYFDPAVVGPYQVVDGGLWANNPSLVAAVEAHYRLKVALDDIRVLSIGTGTSNSFYPRSVGKWQDLFLKSWQGWGIACRWERSKLLDLILNLQSASAHNLLCLMLGEDPRSSTRVLRLSFDSDGPLPMDATRKRDDWIAKADYTFTHSSNEISRFLHL